MSERTLYRWVIAAVLLAAPAACTAATVTAVRLVRQADASPDGNGTFGDWFSYGEPCLNDSAHVAFSADLGGTAGGSTDDEVLVRAREGGPLTLIAREAELIAGGPAAFGRLFPLPRIYVMNNGGRVAFRAPLNNTPGGTSDNDGLFSSVGPGSLTQHVRKGDLAPGYGTAFTLFQPPTINDESPASLAFQASPAGIYLERGGSVARVCWFAQPAPDGNGSVFSFIGVPPAVRPNASEVAIIPHLTGTTFASQDDDGVFLAEVGSFTQVARGRQPAPGGGTYAEFSTPVLNIGGQAAFSFTYNPTSDGTGIARAGALIVRTGQTAPDLNGTFSSLIRDPSLSAGGLVAFTAVFNGTSGGGFDDSGVFRGDGVVLIQVAREDETVPESGGRFASFGNQVAVNAAGQVLFRATLRGTPGGSSDDAGIYLWDQVDGITKVLRLGDVIDGRTVTDFNALTARDFGGFRSLNDASECVARVRFNLATGDGIYLFRVQSTVAVGSPSPASGIELGVAPNPVSSGPLEVHFRLPAAVDHLEVTAFDLAGRAVRTLHEGAAPASGALRWDGRDGQGRTVAPGVYLVRMSAPGWSRVRRVVRVW
ncbi:MAG TPA: choice-of-anchor tandem repeat NxxGxxAF-containing protein [Candidatus Limnocylindria bacterium]|nr:choice-of-anchor tandem repeat NxxGxxAF-containing protein [Candidatus Limnocylindria bacterium]